MRISCVLALLCMYAVALPAQAIQQGKLVVQSGHTAHVNAAAFDASRDLIATASNDYTVRLWKVIPPDVGTLLAVLAGHTGAVLDVSFNPNDETELASCSDDLSVRLWKVGTTTSRVIELDERPSCVAYRPGSNIIGVGSAETATISFFDANTGAPTDRPIQTLASPSALAFSEDGKEIAVGLSNGQVDVFDARTKQRLRTVDISHSPIRNLFYYRSRLVGTSEDGLVGIQTGAQPARIQRVAQHIEDAALAVGSDTLYLSTDDATVLQVNLGSLTIGTLATDAKSVDVVVPTANGDLLIYGEVEAQQYAWWRAAYAKPPFYVMRTPAGIQSAVAYSPNGSLLAVGDNLGHVSVWNLRSPAAPIQINDLRMERILSLTFTDDGERLLIGGFGEEFLVNYSTSSWEVAYRMRGDKAAGEVISFPGDLTYILDLRSHQIHSFSGKTGVIQSLTESGVDLMCLAENGRDLIALEKSRIVRFDARSGERISDTTNRAPFAGTALVAPGRGDYIIVGSLDGQLVRVNVTTGGVERQYRDPHAGCVTSLAVSGDTLYVGRSSGRVQMLHVSDLTLMKREPVIQHAGQVRQVAVPIGGGLVATASNDGSVIIRQLSTDRQLTLVPMDREWVVFGPDGQFDATEQGMREIKVVSGLSAFPLGSLRDSLYRPNLITSLLNNDARVERRSTVLEQVRTPPIIRIEMGTSSLPEPTEVSDSVVRIPARVTITVVGDYHVRLFNNGKLVNLSVLSVDKTGDYPMVLNTGLVQGPNQLRVVAQMAGGPESEDTITIRRLPLSPDLRVSSTAKGPKLWMIAVGINAYKNPAYDLVFARDDAQQMVSALTTKHRGSTAAVDSDLQPMVFEITDRNATAEAVIQAFRTVERDSRPEDALVFYYAGHGAVLATREGPRFVFGLSDVSDLADSRQLERDGLLADTLRAYLLRIRAQRQSVFIDACYSGAVLETFDENSNARYVSELQRSTGATVLAAVLPDRRAKEVSTLKHGLFTYILLEGLKGDARDIDGDITMLSLLNYVSKAVPALSKKLGHGYEQPVMRFEGTAKSFVLTTVR